LQSGLYIVATPIGNMGDMTARAVEVLSAANAVACEDTRITGKLMRYHGLSTQLVRYDEHNAPRSRPGLIKRLLAGEIVALVSDAGTPLVSDPGYKLVREAVDAGILVYPLPGASSVLAALAVSGLPSDRFLFAGFLPPKQAARRSELNDLGEIKATLVFLESAKRLAASLADMAIVLGDRQVAVCRELTKLYEETRRGSLPELAAHYAEAGAPKGEIVLVVGPPTGNHQEIDIDAALAELLADHTVKEATALVAAKTGKPKREVYARALILKSPTKS
jgi:16S rRNA (cytidine1402-2'-O)-methyltransferase